MAPVMQNPSQLSYSGAWPQAEQQGFADLAAPLADGSSQLRSWYDEATELERLLPQLAVRLEEGGRRLRACRRESAAERAGRDGESGELAVANRRLRVAEARLAESEVQTRREQEARHQRERDNRGLRRTLEGLQERLTSLQEEVSHQTESIAEQEVAVDASRVEANSLQKAIGGMAGTREMLEERVASERDRKIRLEVAARARLQHEVEAVRQPLKRELRAEEAEVADVRARLEAREAGARAAAAEVVELREAVRGGRSHAQRHLDERRHLLLEVREQREVHMRLRGELEDTEARLAEQSLEGREARREFCSRHMRALDSRAEARRCWDRDIVVAEDR